MVALVEVEFCLPIDPLAELKHDAVSDFAGMPTGRCCFFLFVLQVMENSRVCFWVEHYSGEGEVESFDAHNHLVDFSCLRLGHVVVGRDAEKVTHSLPFLIQLGSDDVVMSMEGKIFMSHIHHLICIKEGPHARMLLWPLV